jgi:aerobic-type carbon monoxide dehydrogenase small subunit (CoxS/CutS family)
VTDTIAFTLDGRSVEVGDDGCTLLEALRDRLGVRSPKDGCSPQGQCGCCTVLVDGQARVACVTPLARVRGRTVTTVDGLEPATRQRWSSAFAATGASQCGFCTPGIVCRLVAAEEVAARRGGTLDQQGVGQALLAHLCRCTGWQTIFEAASAATAGADGAPVDEARYERDVARSAQRAAIEGHARQRVGPDIALGAGGFADDTAPPDALVAVLAADGTWVVGETLTDARRSAGKVQGRRTTSAVTWPVSLPDLGPDGRPWRRQLQTTWVEPAYLEPDASWCAPGGEPESSLANGGAFGGKAATPVGEVARRLATEHGRPVRVLLSREDVVRLGPKRPPLAAGLSADGRLVVRVVRTPGIEEVVRRAVEAADLQNSAVEVEEVDLVGPPTSAVIRGAGWAEISVLAASLREPDDSGADVIRTLDGAVASASVEADGSVRVRVRCGEVFDDVVLRSYCIGAAHMALGWVRNEAIAVGDDGVPLDLTIRSFGILRAVDMPHIEVAIEPDDAPPVNGSDAVFAAVAAAAWRERGFPPRWPVARG